MSLNITSSTFSMAAQLATVTVSYAIALDLHSDSGNYNIQIFLKNKDTGSYQTINPGIGTLVALLPGSTNRGSFSVILPIGNYGEGKASLFASGTNYSAGSTDMILPDMLLSVVSTQIKVTAPILSRAPLQFGAGNASAQIPYTVKVPKGKGDSFWILAKGSGGFVQKQLALTDFAPANDPLDDYDIATGLMAVNTVQYNNSAPGVYNLQYGLFTGGWSLLQWIYPGDNFEIGGSTWVVKADPKNYPDITKALAPASASFGGFIGGNFGNDLASIGDAPLGTAAHFSILASKGITTLRINIDADKMYACLVAPGTETIYADIVDQVVQNMLLAGLVPVVSPQDMPTGPNAEAKLLALDVALATKYQSAPFMLCLLNEPHGYDWPTWKALASTIAQAVRTAAPSVKIIIDTEGYATDLTACIASPPVDALYDYIGWHPYISLAKLSAATLGGLRVIVEEYHDATPEFHMVLETLKPAGIMAWAWNFPGRDSINLCVSLTGAVETFTSDGNAILGFYSTWLSGAHVQASVPVAPPVPIGGSTAFTGLTLGDVDAEIAKKFATLPAPGLTQAQTDAEIAKAIAALPAAPIPLKLTDVDREIMRFLSPDEIKIKLHEARITALEAQVALVRNTSQIYASAFQTSLKVLTDRVTRLESKNPH